MINVRLHHRLSRRCALRFPAPRRPSSGRIDPGASSPPTPEQIDQAAKRAQDVYERAKSGEDFAKLAVAYSNSQTALDGGSLGWRKGTELPTFLADLVLKLKAGEISEPMRAPTGYHIVKLNDMRSSEKKVVVDQVHARHILMRTTELQDDATVRQKLEILVAKALEYQHLATR